MGPHWTKRIRKRKPHYPNRIRTYRLRQNLRQRDLAALIRVSRSTISAWEGGERLPRARSLFRLGKALSTLIESLYPTFYGIHDTRGTPSVGRGSDRKGHPSVRIPPAITSVFGTISLSVPATVRLSLVAELREIPFEPYAPIRSQLLCILRSIRSVARRASSRSRPGPFV
jgi:transcriptional regulator with XRE-family HTH domain